jgi:hypothetical protein
VLYPTDHQPNLTTFVEVEILGGQKVDAGRLTNESGMKGMKRMNTPLNHLKKI